jgi:hypothetical protein
MFFRCFRLVCHVSFPKLTPFHMLFHSSPSFFPILTFSLCEVFAVANLENAKYHNPPVLNTNYTDVLRPSGLACGNPSSTRPCFLIPNHATGSHSHYHYEQRLVLATASELCANSTGPGHCSRRLHPTRQQYSLPLVCVARRRRATIPFRYRQTGRLDCRPEDPSRAQWHTSNCVGHCKRVGHRRV